MSPSRGHGTSPDGSGTAPSQTGSPWGVTSLTLTCQSTQTKTQERKAVQTWGEMLNLPTLRYSQMPACETVQLKKPQSTSQEQPIGKTGREHGQRVSAEKAINRTGNSGEICKTDFIKELSL